MSGNSAPRLTVFACPACQGRGVTVPLTGTPRPCATCGRSGVVGSLNGTWIVWRRRVTTAAIVEQEVEWISRAVLNGIFLLFSLFGLGIGFWKLTQYLDAGHPLAAFLTERSIPLGVFWLSVLTALYVAYRLERESVSREPMVRLTGAPVRAPASYDEFLAAKEVRDVSQAYHQETLKIIERSWLLARRLGHREFLPIHLLAAILEHHELAPLFVRLNLPFAQVAEKLRRTLERVARGEGGDPVFSSAVNELLLRAYVSAAVDRRGAVDPPDLLIGSIEVASPARELLLDIALDEQKLRNVTAWLTIEKTLRRQWAHYRSRALFKPKGVMDRAMTAQQTPLLEHFSEDLTQFARVSALPHAVARERELSEIFRILESAAGNVLLVGNAGVGKTTLIHAVAERMATEDVPASLRDKRLVALSIPQLVSGAGRIGELEERMAEMLTEIAKAGNVVLVIENIHDLVGVGSAGGQTLDLSDAIVDALKKRFCRVIATTTSADFRKTIEQHSGLASVLEPVAVDEVDPQTAILISEARAGNIEYRQKVLFSYQAIESAVTLSRRYIHGRYLPEKAIDLLEEAAVAVARTKGKNAIVTGEDVAAVVAEKTGVEVTQVTSQETDKLLHLEDRLHERIVGQDEAVRAVAAALRRSRAELRDPNRPIANFLFLGPTGVGKTELAKTIAQVYFGSEQDMVRLDMSEFQDATALTRLLGAPEGFGAGGGYLTEGIRQNPYTILLLDELEKAHPDILNLFLQVMDDGRLTDALGRTIDFTNIILVATSNAATPIIQDRIREGKAVEDIRRELMGGLLLRWFHPEFLNRFDDIIVFRPLTEDDIEKVTRLLLKKVQDQLAVKGIALRASDEAVQELALAGFDPVYGARPLRRVIQDRVDNALATILLQGKLSRRDIAVLEPGGVIRVEKAAEI